MFEKNKKNQKIQVYFNVDEFSKIENFAKENKIKLSFLLREITLNFMEKQDDSN